MKYFLFSKEKTEFDIKSKKNREYSIFLSEERIKRLFNSSNNIDSGIYTIYVFDVEDKETTFSTEFSRLFFDCNCEIKNIIDNYHNVFGYSSKSQNRIIESIIDYSNLDEQNRINHLYGEGGWSSLEEFFDCLNKSDIKYVSLRKNENLPNGFIDGDKDIDILCENKEELVRYFCLKKRSLGISGYQIQLKEEQIPLDVRFKGDFYFDSSWEQRMLEDRLLNENNIYVLDRENQIFTIVYHVLTQKKSISKYYKDFLSNNNITLNEKDLINLLSLYMKKNGYFFHHPTDLSVYQNKKNIKELIKLIGQLSKKKIWMHNFVSKMPNRFFFKTIKTKILNKENS